MDLILRNLRLVEGAAEVETDVGIAQGRIAAIGPGLSAEAEAIDLEGRLAVPGFVESHIHLDKACILERCTSEEGTLAEAVREVAAAKRAFTAEDIHARAAKTLETCVLQGTTRMRTHIEVDPVIGMKGIEAVLPLIESYRWAVATAAAPP